MTREQWYCFHRQNRIIAREVREAAIDLLVYGNTFYQEQPDGTVRHISVHEIGVLSNRVKK